MFDSALASVRHRQRPHVAGSSTTPAEAPEAPPAPAPCSADALDDTQARDDDTHTARLREVLRLTAQHLPQAEIAYRFNVTVRTIRRWVEEARQRRLGTFRRVTPDELLADTEHLHASLKAKLLRRMDAADAARDDRLWLECVKQVRALERDRYTIREKVGFFADYRAVPSTAEEAPDASETRDVDRYLLHILRGDPLRTDASADHGAGEGTEPIPIY